MAVFYNQATLSYSGGTTNSNIASGEVVEALIATKRAVSDGYTAGGSIVYVISIENSSGTEVTGLTVTDDLGGYAFGGTTLYPLTYVEDSLLYYVGGVPTAAPAVVAGPPLVISGIDIPASSNVTLIYETNVNEFAPLGADACITNTAVVSGGCPAEGEATVCLEQRPLLTINKSVSPDTVSCNGEVTYTFVLQNAGSEATAADEVVIADTFDPILSGLTVELDGAAFTSFTYDETTGVFATTAGAITVPGATATQNSEGVWTVTPGVTVLTVTGSI